VLLSAAPEALFAGSARSGAQSAPQPFQELEILGHACRLVEHAMILAGLVHCPENLSPRLHRLDALGTTRRLANAEPA
jgi:hypothetical protein